MCVQGFFQAQDIVPHYTSYAAGLGKPNSIIELAQGFLVVLTAFLLIPRMGFLGASVAQLWVIITVIVHSIWVRRAVTPEVHPLGWIKAYISPLLMVAVWLLVVNLLKTHSSSIVFFYATVVIGGLIGFSVLMIIERTVFIDEHRWSTLSKVISLPIRRVFSSNLS